jgi:hypothetical protein
MPEAIFLENEQVRLDHMASCGLDRVDIVPEADSIMARLAHDVGTEFAMVSLVWSEEIFLFSGVGLPIGRVQRAIGICGHALLDAAEPLIITDTRYDARTMDSPFVLGPPFIRSYAGQAFCLEQDLPVGVLFVAGLSPRKFSAQNLASLQRAVQNVIPLLQRRRAHAFIQ